MFNSEFSIFPVPGCLIALGQLIDNLEMGERVLCVNLLIELLMGCRIVTNLFDQKMNRRFIQTVLICIWLPGQICSAIN